MRNWIKLQDSFVRRDSIQTLKFGDYEYKDSGHTIYISLSTPAMCFNETFETIEARNKRLKELKDLIGIDE